MKKILITFGVLVIVIGVWVGRRPKKAHLDSAQFILYHGSKDEDNTTFTLDEFDQIHKHNKFDHSRPTVLYFHGFVEKMTDEHIHVIVDAYLTRNDHNFIMVNWTELADGSYLLDAIPNSVKLAKIIGTKLVKMSTNGFPIEKLHLVGHSLGGQLVGYIGRTVMDESERKLKLKRITALDPAFPGFYPAIVGTHLSKKDADLVDIIHTDAWLYGSPTSTGTVDFWPNAGKTLQPGCPKRNYKILSDIDLCSHRRSWRFWAESIKTTDQQTFQSIRCDSWKQFKAGKYDAKNEIISMGIDCPSSAKGDYYLQTNGGTPFSLGMIGTKYEKQSK